ncbi:hypothetical protein TrispH2_007958 [Trichoplax sp. H2]|nr:hypothetical protein TrispH2_007958 [Trichoplax sp. H2]|eukprot:RDD40140.1 hypothetical protein TrispH2_007958 [Trichoplax sp. H2]
MLCGIKTEFAVPKLDSPDHGYIGGRGVNDAELNECITLAIKRARDMRDLLS